MIRIKQMRLETENGRVLHVDQHTVKSLGDLDAMAEGGPCTLRITGGQDVQVGEQRELFPMTPPLRKVLRTRAEQRAIHAAATNGNGERPEKPGRGYIWISPGTDGRPGHWRKRRRSKQQRQKISRAARLRAGKTPEERAEWGRKMAEYRRVKRAKEPIAS